VCCCLVLLDLETAIAVMGEMNLDSISKHQLENRICF